MGIEMFLVFYLILSIIVVSLEICLLFFSTNDKGKYLHISYKALKSIFESSSNENNIVDAKMFSHEIERFYNESFQELPQFKTFYPNVVVWIDAIIFKIDIGNKKAAELKSYITCLKCSRDILVKENPYNKCEKYQQTILRDIERIQTPENAILVQNILSRLEDEFLRLAIDIKSNRKINIASLMIGAAGIVVSILMALVKA